MLSSGSSFDDPTKRSFNKAHSSVVRTIVAPSEYSNQAVRMAFQGNSNKAEDQNALLYVASICELFFSFRPLFGLRSLRSPPLQTVHTIIKATPTPPKSCHRVGAWKIAIQVGEVADTCRLMGRLGLLLIRRLLTERRITCMESAPSRMSR